MSDSALGSISIRPVTILSSDTYNMASVAYVTYLNTPLILFLNPTCGDYPKTATRGYWYRSLGRLLNPRNRSFVATSVTPRSEKGEPTQQEQIIGYIQFVRLGDDFACNWIVRVYWAILAFVWKLYSNFVYFVSPDPSENLANLAKFLKWGKVDDARYWDVVAFPDRKERWHVQSFVVSPEWQRKGVGKKLMGEVIKVAQAEGVPIGIEATSAGRRMYEKVGFEYLGEFHGDDLGEPDGGVLIWRPEGFQIGKVEGNKEL